MLNFFIVLIKDKRCVVTIQKTTEKVGGRTRFINVPCILWRQNSTVVSGQPNLSTKSRTVGKNQIPLVRVCVWRIKDGIRVDIGIHQFSIDIRICIVCVETHGDTYPFLYIDIWNGNRLCRGGRRG